MKPRQNENDMMNSLTIYTYVYMHIVQFDQRELKFNGNRYLINQDDYCIIECIKYTFESNFAEMFQLFGRISQFFLNDIFVNY